MTSRRQLLHTALALPWIARTPMAYAADAGVTDREIVLGQSAVLSGPLGAALKAFNAGARLAFDATNASGGVYGRRLRLVSLDDELKPARAVDNYKTLLAQHGVFAFFGGVGSGTIAAAVPVLRESNAPLIGNYALSDATRDKALNAAYFVRATYRREAEKLVQHLSTLGMTRIAVAHLANPGGDEVLAQVRQAVQSHGQADVAGSAAIQNDGSNVADAARALASTQAQVVIMFLSGPPIARLMQTMWDNGASPQFYGMSVVAGDLVAQALGGRLRGLATSQVMPYPWSESDPTAREYRSRSIAAHVPVGYASFEGYVNALVMIEALRAAGRSPTRDSLHQGIRSLRFRVAGVDIDFTGRKHTGSQFVELAHVTPDGRYRR
ncbi:MAG: ABC transporter substrate-binding protein [Burkholderiaceae bacterium]|jgi:ABC-type branched-subunit amino acid transport system substrate-binding protein|nr:ABC transporter substrate-binding protein [Aquabacterium sp.]NUP87606.1 ABC transporter substrate-binding protein [Burkholderiaceae bacterium]